MQKCRSCAYRDRYGWVDPYRLRRSRPDEAEGFRGSKAAHTLSPGLLFMVVFVVISCPSSSVYHHQYHYHNFRCHGYYHVYYHVFCVLSHLFRRLVYTLFGLLCGRVSPGHTGGSPAREFFSSVVFLFSTFLVRCWPYFLSREGYSGPFPSSTAK